MSRTVLFYRTADGKYPVQDFLDALPGKAAQKVAWVLYTHGFGKKSMKTPHQEIYRSEAYRRDYLNRKGKKR
ncbi:MAG: hypothetical protein JW793_15135 [Acidobacteria bacterium]|nr:hypothetical protein [Acidobacteriota bacterium]